MFRIDQSALQIVSFPGDSKDGGRSIYVPMNSADFFAAGDGTLELDLESIQTRGYFSGLQCLYIDNRASGVNGVLDVTIVGSGQLIKARTTSQGYYPVVSPNPIRIRFFRTLPTAASTQPSYVILMNTVVPAVQWTV